MQLRHFLQFKDLSREEHEHLFARTRSIKDRFKRYERYWPLEDRTLAMIFEKQSPRTRLSFEAGMHPLGLERKARARRLLLEDHRQRAVFERPVAFVALEAVFDRAGAREQMLVLFAREVLELQEVAQLHRRQFSINAPPPWAARYARGSSAQ